MLRGLCPGHGSGTAAGLGREGRALPAGSEAAPPRGGHGESPQLLTESGLPTTRRRGPARRQAGLSGSENRRKCGGFLNGTRWALGDKGRFLESSCEFLGTGVMVSEDKLGKYSHGLASCGWEDVWRESVEKPEPSGVGPGERPARCRAAAGGRGRQRPPHRTPEVRGPRSLHQGWSCAGETPGRPLRPTRVCSSLCRGGRQASSGRPPLRAPHWADGCAKGMQYWV